MNLRVDLIVEAEQRSARFFSVKTISRIAALIVPLFFGSLVLTEISKSFQLRDELSDIETDWDITKRRSDKAEELSQNFQVNRMIQSELKGWRNTHVDWHDQLTGILRHVPAEVQLTNLRISQLLQLMDERVPARIFTMTMKGRSVGASSEENVQHLEQRLRESEPFAALMKEVTVSSYGADLTEDADKDDRIFDIRCSYMEREFK